MISSRYSDVARGLRDVGDLILSWRKEKLCLTVHDRENLKTEGDKQADLRIRNLINGIFSNAEIVSEEDEFINQVRPDKYWLVDPIDGTASWLEGYAGYVTQLAYIEFGVPKFGVIYAPALDKIWFAEAGRGAYLNGKQIVQSVQSIKELLSDGIVLTDNYPEPRRVALEVFKNFNIKSYYESGSIGLKSVLALDGTVDLFVKDVVLRDWDVAPAYSIAQETGGCIYDLEGKEYSFMGRFEKNTGLIVSRSQGLVKTVVSFLAKNTSDWR